MEHLKPLEDAITILRKLTVDLSTETKFAWTKVYHAECYLIAEYMTQANAYFSEASNG